MTFKDKIQLVVKGIPIVSKYRLHLSEKLFKNISETKLTAEDDMNPFSLSSPRFRGHFHGHYGREFSIKPKSSFFKKDSISNSIWVHGKIDPLDEEYLTLIVTFYRTNFSKYGQWVLAGTIGFIFLLISIRTLGISDFKNFLIFGGALMFFYFMGTLISVSQTNGQIKYFEKYFIEEIRKNKKTDANRVDPSD
jgi:hypothetical protein